MAAEATTSSEGIPKWQLALALGIPSLIGLGGVWYWRRQRRKKLDTHEDAPKAVPVNTPEESEKLILPKDRAQSAKNKGNAFFKGQKYEEAISCYTEAIHICPEDCRDDLSTYYQNRAAAYEQLRKFDKVLDDCTEALKYNQQYLKALHRRAKACETLGGNSNLEQCLEDITAVCILEQFSNQASLIMADRVLKEVGGAKARKFFEERTPVDPSPYFIRNFFQSFANDPVLADAEELLREDGEQDTGAGDIPTVTIDRPRTPYEIAALKLKQGDFKDILRLASEEIANSESPKMAEALLLRATFYMLRGESKEALQDIEKVLNTADCSKKVRSNAYIKLANLQMQEAKHDQSLATYAKAIREDPENSDIYHHRGQVNLLTEHVDDAVRDFEKSVELQPSFAIAHVQKCYTEYRLALQDQDNKKLLQCMDKFKDTVDKFRDCSEGFALYGQALLDQSSYEKADEYFKLSSELDPDNGNILVHRGLLRLQWTSNVDEAVDFIEKALVKDGKCEFAYETLGTIEVQRGNLSKAVQLFRQAISFAKTEVEMVHLCSLLEAALAQIRVAQRFGYTDLNLRI